MDTSQLTAFIAVAESESFSLAADKLHLTQPAISKRIALLEQHLDTRLFDRIGRRVSLTESGHLLLPRAQQTIRGLEDTQVMIRNLSGDISGRLSIASSHHIGLHRLPPVLKQFSRKYPEVSLDISFLDSEQAYHRVLHGELELAVVTLSLDKPERVYEEVIWDDALEVMVSTDHPLARKGTIQLADLAQFAAILPGQNTFTRQLIEAAFSKTRQRLVVEMETNYLETIRMIVSIGMAWSILPQSMCDKQLQMLKVPGLRLNRKLGYIYHRDHTLSNACRALIDCLKMKAEG